MGAIGTPVRLLALFCLVCLLLTCSIAGFSQSTAGRLVGNISDPSGAVLPGAKVTAKNTGTGVQQTVTTNENGDYAVFPLPPGTYDLTAEKTGFRSTSLRGIVLDVSTTLSHNFRLPVGSTAEEVTVSAAAVPLLPQSISVESVITQQQLDVLPLNGRDFNQLVLLTPGATDNTAATNVNLDFGSYALQGNRSFSNEYLVDGVPNNNPFQGKAATPLSVDALAEFKVIAGVPPAEYGHAGTAITSITKSGTNSFHGSLFNYYRGDVLLAADPFNMLGDRETFLRNQFGGSVAGPVRIPGVFDSRGRTFFFFAYEGSRQTDTATRVDTVPLASFWSGDLSSLLARNIQLRDPFTAGRPNIPGNRLDLYKSGALISKTALALRAFYSDPNLPGLSNNLVQFPDESSNADQFTVRLDQARAGGQLLSLRLTYANSGSFQPNLLGSVGAGISEPQDSRNGSITWTAPLGTRMVNELRFGAMNYSDIVTYIDGNLPTVESLGMQGFDTGNPGIPPLPRIVFSGTDAFTSIKYGPTNGFGEAALSMVSNIFTVADAFSLSMGKHTFKFGFEGRRDYFNVLQQTNARGQLTFSGSKTSSTSTGYSFADFLIGLPSSTQQVPVKPKSALRENEYAGFAQDTWHVRSNLTLDLGLRYELSPSPVEAKNRLSMFSGRVPGGGFVVACSNGQLPTNQFLPSVVAKLTDANGNWTYPVVCGSQYGHNSANLVSTGTRNFAPRAGLVWDPTGKGLYSVRAGYGIVYTRYPVQYFLQTMLVNPPFAGLFPYSQRITSGVAALTLGSPYGGSGGATVSPIGIESNFVLPNNQQWNLAVARAFGSKTSLLLAYVGNKGTHLFRSFNVNQLEVDPATGALVRTYSSTFGTSNIPVRRSDGNSTYHAMTIEARRRAAKNVDLQANWTWAKAIDNVSTNVQSTGLDILSPGRDRADSDYARRHTISFNSTYSLPFGRGHALGSNLPGWADVVAGGWMLSGIWHWSTGRFLTASYTAQGGLASNRPDVVPGISPNLPRDQRTKDRWFNPAAFAPAPVVDPATGLPRFGNAGRNTIIGPGLNVVDMSLRKAFRLGENRRLSVEASLFNAFNHPNWGNPDTNISNANTVGTVNNLSKPMRQAQFAARFAF